jgi:hypothetical protein
MPHLRAAVQPQTWHWDAHTQASSGQQAMVSIHT